MGNFVDRSQQTYGSWFIIRRASKQDIVEKRINRKIKEAYWIARCQCGRVEILSGSSLQTGSSKQCKACCGFLRKSPIDYHNLAVLQNKKWIGPEVTNNRRLTVWECDQSHQWLASYSNIQKGKGCPHCDFRVNGIKVSKPQKEISEMVQGELNYKLNSMFIDIALPLRKIAIEYDGWYWHKNKKQKDLDRVQCLLDSGWKVLVIKSRTRIPEPQQIQAALDTLSTIPYTEIILPDWKSN